METMNSSFSFRALLGHLDLCSVCTGLGFQREVIRKYRAVCVRVTGIPLYAEVRRAYFKPLSSWSYTRELKSTAHRVALIEPVLISTILLLRRKCETKNLSIEAPF